MSIMWEKLPEQEKKEYKKMILAFASLSKMFAQKSENESDDNITPVINSKYQETVFQKVFHAVAEDIGNTSYDVSLCLNDDSGEILKYLIGIKTFGFGSGSQKVAQFKASHNEWATIIEQMEQNAHDRNGKRLSKQKIDNANKALYKELALKIAKLRNDRIESSEANLQGFSVTNEDDVQAVYHVLMPSKGNESGPKIFVGETNYNKIDIDNIVIKGCTKANNPTNFKFSDGNHDYIFTSADSQLLMQFHDNDIVLDEWDVTYAEDAYAFFADIGKEVYAEHNSQEISYSEISKREKDESYSWLIESDNGEVELFSGFNGFFGVGSKLPKDKREEAIHKFSLKYEDIFSRSSLSIIVDKLYIFFFDSASNKEEKYAKARLRDSIVEYVEKLGNAEATSDIKKILYRPKDEMYIPIPQAAKFHNAHPDFFGEGIGKLKREGGKWKPIVPKKEDRKFSIVFEPSGDEIEAFLTQDNLKGIESSEKQSILGEWILRKIFQLPDFKPLTARRLREIGINGIRLVKDSDTGKIHLFFIWIDKDHLPEDYLLD